MNPHNPTEPVQVEGSETVEMVARAMRRCGEDFYRAAQLPTDTRERQADRAARLAEVAERRARWWGVLIRSVMASGSGASWVYASAALTAQRHEESEARLWRESAASLSTGPSQRPVTGVVDRVEFRSAS